MTLLATGNEQFEPTEVNDDDDDDVIDVMLTFVLNIYVILI